MKRVLSGIQPSGTLHLGNYFGAIKQFVDLQNDSDNYIFIANYHALTTLRDPRELHDNSLDIAMHYLAFGLDPEKTTLFKQSDVPQVCELSWILSTLTPMGLLERCHSYKDKIAKGFAPEHGLFAYPVLMAADILIYQADIVPVGKDQKQHVEVARDLALKFNNTYGEVFKLPEESINKTTATVPGIDGQKMSKSYDNCITMFESNKDMKKKVMNIVTDSTPLEDPKNPEECNVFTLYKLFASEAEIATMADNYRKGGYGYGHAKKELLAKILEYFGPARERYQELREDRSYVEKVLKEGALRANEAAEKTMKEVRKAVGLC